MKPGREPSSKYCRPNVALLRLKLIYIFMSDFFQNGIITTLHNFYALSGCAETELSEFAKDCPMTLIFCVCTRTGSAKRTKIVQELAGVEYLKHIVIGLDRATEASTSICDYFGVLHNTYSDLE